MLLASTREAVRRHQLREEALFVPFAAVLQPVRQARRERSLHARRTHRAVQLRCQVLVEEAAWSTTLPYRCRACVLQRSEILAHGDRKIVQIQTSLSQELMDEPSRCRSH